MSSNRDFVIAVIDMFRDHIYLWKTTDPGYHNKVKRNVALEMLLEFFKTVDHAATKDVVTKKLNSMRGSFWKQLNKIKILEDQEDPRPSKNIASVLDEMPFEYDESDFDDAVETNSQATSSRPQIPVGKFKRPRSKANQVLDKIAKRMDQPEKLHQKERFALFGEHVVEKLRYMPPEMLPIYESDCIFQGEIKT